MYHNGVDIKYFDKILRLNSKKVSLAGTEDSKV